MTPDTPLARTASRPGRDGRPARIRLLDAAACLLPDKGYAGLRIADVAAATGLSRQTVYNEFGDKAGLVQAVVLRETAEFLDGVAERLQGAPDALSGIAAAAAYTVVHGSENAIVASMLGHRAAEDLLPYLTTRAEPVLHAATTLVSGHLRRHRPALSEARADLLAEAVVRLTISHLLLPGHAAERPEAVADRIAAVIRPAVNLEDHSG